MNKGFKFSFLSLLLAWLILITGCRLPGISMTVGLSIRGLSAESEMIRWKAIENLYIRTDIPVKFVPELEQALKLEYFESVTSAAQALCKITPLESETVPALVKALSAVSDPYVKIEIVDALTRYLNEYPETATAFTHILRTEPSPDVKGRAVKAIRILEDPEDELLHALIQLFDSADVGLRNAAANTLAEYGELALPMLMERITCGRAYGDLFTSRALHGIGEPAIEPLLEAFASEKIYIRKDAAAVLSKFILYNGSQVFAPYGDPDDLELKIMLVHNYRVKMESLPRLLEMYECDDPMERFTGFEGITRIYPRDETVREILFSAVDDSDPAIRAVAYKGIGKNIPATEKTIRCLLDGLNDPEEQVRKKALASMQSLGGDHRNMILQFWEEYKGGDNSLAKLFMMGLIQWENPLPPEEILTVCIDLLQSDLPFVRSDISHAIGKYLIVHPDEFAPIIPYLIEALDDEDMQVFVNCCLALGYFGPMAEDAIPKLEEFASYAGDDRNFSRRSRYAENAIKKITVEIEDSSE